MDPGRTVVNGAASAARIVRGADTGRGSQWWAGSPGRNLMSSSEVYLLPWCPGRKVERFCERRGRPELPRPPNIRSSASLSSFFSSCRFARSDFSCSRPLRVDSDTSLLAITHLLVPPPHRGRPVPAHLQAPVCGGIPSTLRCTSLIAICQGGIWSGIDFPPTLPVQFIALTPIADTDPGSNPSPNPARPGCARSIQEASWPRG